MRKSNKKLFICPESLNHEQHLKFMELILANEGLISNKNKEEMDPIYFSNGKSYQIEVTEGYDFNKGEISTVVSLKEIKK